MFSLTHSQKRIIVNQQIYPESKFAHMYGMVYTENQNYAKLSEAMNAAISFFDCLRIRFIRADTDIFQEISDYQHEGIGTKPSDFDFSKERLSIFCGKLYRFYIVGENDRPSGYYFIIHHAIADAYTITLIIKFIGEYLDGKANNYTPQQFQIYALTEQEYLLSGDYKADYDFFEKRLARSLSFKYMPEFDLSCKRAGKGLSSGQSQAMLSFCKQKGISVFKLIYAALFILLYLENGRTIQTISTTHHNRNTKGLLQTGGMITSTIPIVQDIDFSLTFEEFLAETILNVNESLERHRFPVDILLAGEKSKRTFDLDLTEVTLNSIPFGDGSRISRFSPNEDVSCLNFKLNPNSNLKGANIEIAVDYSTARYAPPQASRMLDRLTEIAFMFIENGNSVISEAIAPRGDIMTRIREIILSYPERLAVTDGDNAITYRQLGEKMDAVADTLMESSHVVGIVNHRSVWYVIAAFGALMAGKAFTVLDPELSMIRAEDITRQAKIDTVLAFSDAGKNLKNVKTVDIRDLSPPKSKIPVCVSDLAYILFTSGSSGSPKGVMVSRHGLLSMIESMAIRFGIKGNERFSAYCDFNFDVSIAEIFLPILTASTLYIANEAQRHDLRLLERLLRDNKIGNVFLPTKAGEAFIKSFPDCPILRLTIAGEKMNYYQKTKYHVFNGYGPTEFTVSSHIERISGESARYSIGPPLVGVSDMVVNSSGKLADVGELILIGKQAAIGYLNDYSLTAKRFIRILSPDGETIQRAYRTSDKVERDSDGKLYFLSRMDRQIKFRGYRIELEGIESSAMASGLVSEAVCLIFENEIILSVIPGASYNETKLSRFLSAILPRYATPHRIITVSGFPKTKTGKTDYTAYTNDMAANAVKHINPKVAPPPALTPTEKKLTRILSAHAPGQAQELALTDNIFDAGIDSLGILQVMLEVERKLKSSVSFSDFVLQPTIRELAAHIDMGGGRQNVAKLREGAGNPLVLVFDISMDIISYQRILGELELGYPVYGISPNRIPPKSSLEEYAGFLAGELLKQGSCDRYSFAGYSSGGVVALEIARHLGEKAGSVFLIDTPNYKIYPEMLNFKLLMKNIFTSIRYYSITVFFNYALRYLREIKQKKIIVAEWSKLSRMIRAYEPEAYGVPVFLLTSSETEARTDSNLGWQPHIPEDMVTRLGSGHISIMKKKAADIARIIDSNRVCQRDSSRTHP